MADCSVEGLCAQCLGALNFATGSILTGASPVPPVPVLPPSELAPHFPQLEILTCLGRGGMGVVYKARQKSLNRFVALKLLAPERAGDPDFAARFEKEAQALAALNHPHIVGVYDSGQAGGFYFLLIEFVDGVNLRQLLQTRRLTPQEALSIMPPVCDALQCAHARGIVHRDIKPENLLLDRAGNVKIADFGVAKMMGERDTSSPSGSPAAPGSANSFACGTPDYAAPEQRENAATDHRADIYSLGVVLYEMLTGERPKDRMEPPSRRVQVDVRIDEIVLRALERTPELRFATAAEFRTQVEAVQHSRIVPPPRQRMAGRAVVAAALVLTAGLFFFQASAGRSLTSLDFWSRNVLSTSPIDPLQQATDELEASAFELLNIEKENALDATDQGPFNEARQRARVDRTQRLRTLTAREQELRRAVQTLTGDAPVPDNNAHNPNTP